MGPGSREDDLASLDTASSNADLATTSSTAPREIVLCLSGGGFRATFFHLGVVRYLSEAGILGRVREIYSVSGGSVLAGHLGLHWEDYLDPSRFGITAQAVIGFGRSDVRGGLIRTAPHIWRRRRTKRYEALLARFYEKKTLTQLQGPTYHILTTSVSRGKLLSFRSQLSPQNVRLAALEFYDVETATPFPLGNASVSLAVAASSAFPPFFPPVILHGVQANKDDRPDTERLTDGGVYDNLGVSAACQAAKPGDFIIASDASARLDWERSSFARRLLGIVLRNWRATDIAMQRLASLARQHYPKVDSWLTIGPGQGIHAAREPGYHLREQVARIRTDLDGFSPLEIKALVQSGFEEAHARLNSDAARLGGRPLPICSPWDPFEGMKYWRSLAIVPLATLHEDLRHVLEWRPFSPPVVAVDADKLKASSRVRLLRARHVFGIAWVVVIATGLAFLSFFANRLVLALGRAPRTLQVCIENNGLKHDIGHELLLLQSKAPETQFRWNDESTVCDIVLTSDLARYGDRLWKWSDLLRSPVVAVESDLPQPSELGPPATSTPTNAKSSGHWPQDWGGWVRLQLARMLPRRLAWVAHLSGPLTQRRLEALGKRLVLDDTGAGVALASDVRVLWYRETLLSRPHPSEVLDETDLKRVLAALHGLRSPAGNAATALIVPEDWRAEYASATQRHTDKTFRVVDSPDEVLEKLLHNRAILAPGLASWLGGRTELTWQIQCIPRAFDQRPKMVFWYLAVAVESGERDAAANAILQLAESSALRERLRGRGYGAGNETEPTCPVHKTRGS